MNILKYLLPVALLTCYTSTLIAGSQVTTYLAPHTPSLNLARQRMGLQMLTNYIDEDDHRPLFCLTGWVTESFREKQIARCFFGSDYNECARQLIIAGSQVEDRSRHDWLADYFGLPTDFKSCINFEPLMINAILEPYIFWQFAPHLFVTGYLPFGYTRWAMHLHEKVISKGTNALEPGYFDNEATPREDLLECFSSFISGAAVPQLAQTKIHHLHNAKISPCPLSKTGMTEAVLALGWRAVNRESLIFDIYLRGAIPGGNRPEGVYLFEPILGNGRHGELGAGLSFECMMWECEPRDEYVFFSFDFVASHLFATRQRRSFDVCNKPNSRYMLASKLSTPIKQNLIGLAQGNGVTPTAQFKHEFTPLANLTTDWVKVTIPAQVNLSILVTYERCQMYWTFGYGFWRRSCENICPISRSCLADGIWALKGDAHVIGFEAPSNTPVPLSATQSRATIHAGRNTPTQGADQPDELAAAAQNPYIDNPAPALADSANSGIHHPLFTTSNGTDQINTSIQPIFVCPNDIDYLSAASHGSAHDIVGQFGYTWYERCHTPFIGFGAEVELGHGGQSTSPRENECINCSLSFWSIWLKGGFAIG